MLYGLAGDVDTKEGAVSVVRDLDVNGEALCVLLVSTNTDVTYTLHSSVDFVD